MYPTDPAGRIEMQTKELNNGRVAMIAMAGMVAQELPRAPALLGPRTCPNSLSRAGSRACLFHLPPSFVWHMAWAPYRAALRPRLLAGRGSCSPPATRRGLCVCTQNVLSLASS